MAYQSLVAGDFSMSEGQKSLAIAGLSCATGTLVMVLDPRGPLLCVFAAEGTEVNQRRLLTKSSSASNRTDTSRPGIDAGGATILSQRKVEHCVQYRETDFNFLSRTLERLGVSTISSMKPTSTPWSYATWLTTPKPSRKSYATRLRRVVKPTRTTSINGSMRMSLSRANGSKPITTLPSPRPV